MAEIHDLGDKGDSHDARIGQPVPHSPVNVYVIAFNQAGSPVPILITKNGEVKLARDCSDTEAIVLDGISFPGGA